MINDVSFSNTGITQTQPDILNSPKDLIIYEKGFATATTQHIIVTLKNPKKLSLIEFKTHEHLLNNFSVKIEGDRGVLYDQIPRREKVRLGIKDGNFVLL